MMNTTMAIVITAFVAAAMIFKGHGVNLEIVDESDKAIKSDGPPKAEANTEPSTSPRRAAAPELEVDSKRELKKVSRRIAPADFAAEVREKGRIAKAKKAAQLVADKVSKAAAAPSSKEDATGEALAEVISDDPNKEVKMLEATLKQSKEVATLKQEATAMLDVHDMAKAEDAPSAKPVVFTVAGLIDDDTCMNGGFFLTNKKKKNGKPSYKNENGAKVWWRKAGFFSKLRGEWIITRFSSPGKGMSRDRFSNKQYDEKPPTHGWVALKDDTPISSLVLTYKDAQAVVPGYTTYIGQDQFDILAHY